MAIRHGKKGVFKIDDSGGTERDLSAYTDEVSISRSQDTAESTTFGASAKSYVIGLVDGTISASGKFDAGSSTVVDDVLSSLLGQTSTASFVIRSSSDAIGASNPEYQGECIMTSYDVSAPLGDVVTWSADFQITGAVTRATA